MNKVLSSDLVPAPRILISLCLLLLALVALGPALRGEEPGPPAALTLHTERASPQDLAITGRLAGVPARATRYVRWAELRALPTTRLKLDGEFVPGEQEVTVLFLADLWKRLPSTDGADTLLASCNDGYAAIFREAFIKEYRPFLILEIEGAGPAQWPPKGLSFNPGPYVISVAATVVPAVATLLDSGHKRPWGVEALEVANYADRFQAVHNGPWAALSPAGQAGRELWINSCLSCHQGPGDIFGGTKSGRPFPVLAAHAGYNVEYFKKYVRNPQAMVSSAKMEAHPHYTDAQLDEIIAFILGK